MSFIFRNKYQTRLIIDDMKSGTQRPDNPASNQPSWGHVVLGVYSRHGKMPEIFGIPMSYEEGPMPLSRVQVDSHNDMHLTADTVFVLIQKQVLDLALYGLIEVEDGFVQLLASVIR